MTPMEAFTQLYEQWPMRPEYRELAWATIKSALLAAQQPKPKTITPCDHEWSDSRKNSIVSCRRCGEIE